MRRGSSRCVRNRVATGQAMKTAVKEVLSSTEGEDDWGSVDVDSLNIDDIQRRFETLRAMKFSSGSLGTYKSRFRKSLEMFDEFRQNPSTWRPSVKTRNRKSKENTARDARPAPIATPSNLPSASSGTSDSHSSSHRSSIVTYPFPIRDGVLAALELPADLTEREAERVAAFVASLAMDTTKRPTDET